MQPARIAFAFSASAHDNTVPIRLGLSGIVGYNFPAPVAVLNLLNICWPYDNASPQHGVLLVCIDGCQPNALFCDTGSYNYTWAIPLHLQTSGVWTWYTQTPDENRLFIPLERLQHDITVTLRFVDPTTGLMLPLPPNQAGTASVMEISVQPNRF